MIGSRILEGDILNMTKSAKIISFVLTIVMVFSVACSMMVQSVAAAAPTLELKQESLSGNTLEVQINIKSGSFNAIDIRFVTKGLKCENIGIGEAAEEVTKTNGVFSSNANAPSSAYHISMATSDGFFKKDKYGVVTSTPVTGTIAYVKFTITDKSNYSFTLNIEECKVADANGNTSSVTPVVTGKIASSSSTTTYTLTYNANGGSNAPSAQKVEANKSFNISTSKPTRSGYTFLGWSTNKNATSATYSAGASMKLSANTTLYAVWKKNATTTNYTLTYNANGGSNAPSSQKVATNTSFKISASKPTRSGYTFLGWSTNKNATTATYAAGASMKLSANTTLYAVWKKNATTTNYTLTYNANGGLNAPSSQKIEANTSFNISSLKPTRSGYTFLGWSTNKNATVATYAAGASMKLSANTTLYAVWKEGKVNTIIPTGTLPSDVTASTTTSTTTSTTVSDIFGSDPSSTESSYSYVENTTFDYGNQMSESEAVDSDSNNVLDKTLDKKVVIIIAAIILVLVAGAVVAFVLINKKKNDGNF